MICPTCATDNRDGVKFCSRCGTPLPSPSDAPYQSVYQQPGQGYQQPEQSYGQPGPGSATPPPSYAGGMQQVAPQFGYAYGAPAGAHRDVAVSIILTLVTCGFYHLYWVYKMYGEVAADLGRDDINPALEILFSILSCGIYGIFLAYKYPKLINEMQARRGMPVNDFSVMSLVFACFGFHVVSHAIMQNELNRIWAASSPGGRM